MKILIITNMWPTLKYQYFGIHVKEQVDSIKKIPGTDVSAYFINAYEKGKIEYLTSIFKIWVILQKNQYDIIHIHYGISGLFLLFFKPKGKVFLTLHGGDILKKQKKFIQIFISKLIIKRVRKVYILNNEMEGIVKNLNVNYEILPCGVDFDFFSPFQIIKDTSENLKLILFPGDPLRKVKNYQLFERILNILKNQSKYNIEYKCIHNLSREEVRNLMNEADCLLMTSLSEGSPQVIKEALACNLPIVSVPVGDVKIVLKEIPCCFISETYNPNDLALLVIKSLEYDRTGIRASFLSKRIYDNKLICNKIMENYKAV